MELDPHGCYVYILWGCTRRPLYVGKSTNILSRVGDHVSNPGRRAQIATIQILRCESRPIMDELELSLIDLHQPPWNVVGRNDGYQDEECEIDGCPELAYRSRLCQRHYLAFN
jgi:excinuclease UvrABC nuclease subunit